MRNLERAGVSRSAAMPMVGHKTKAIYRRLGEAGPTRWWAKSWAKCVKILCALMSHSLILYRGGVAKLATAEDLKSSVRKDLQVRLLPPLPSAPIQPPAGLGATQFPAYGDPLGM